MAALLSPGEASERLNFASGSTFDFSSVARVDLSWAIESLAGQILLKRRVPC